MVIYNWKGSWKAMKMNEEVEKARIVNLTATKAEERDALGDGTDGSFLLVEFLILCGIALRWIYLTFSIV